MTYTDTEKLQDNIRLAKGITDLTTVTDKAIRLLAQAILELDDREEPGLRLGTRDAMRTLAEDAE